MYKDKKKIGDVIFLLDDVILNEYNSLKNIGCPKSPSHILNFNIKA